MIAQCQFQSSRLWLHCGTLTLVITLVDSWDGRHFEQYAEWEGLNDYGSALWWTAMLMI